MPKKKVKTEPADAQMETPEDGVLDNATALLQAANALDRAYHLAVESRDQKSLLQVASLWMKMSEGLGNQADVRPPQQQTPMGFQVIDVTEKAIRDEAEDE